MIPKLITVYRCPKCDGVCECHITSLWDKQKEIWDCNSCKRRFYLYFKEVKKVKKKIHS